MALGEKAPPGHPDTHGTHRPSPSHQHSRGKVGGHNNQVAAPLYPQPTLATVQTPMATTPTTVSLPGPSLPQHARPSASTLRLPHGLWIKSKLLATLCSYWSSVASTPPHPHPYSGPKKLVFPHLTSTLCKCCRPTLAASSKVHQSHLLQKTFPDAPPCPPKVTHSLLTALKSPWTQLHITALVGRPRAAVSRPTEPFPDKGRVLFTFPRGASTKLSTELRPNICILARSFVHLLRKHFPSHSSGPNTSGARDFVPCFLGTGSFLFKPQK